MHPKNRPVTALLLGIAAVSALHFIAQSQPAVRRILFVGDSFTYSQDGVYTHFERLAAAVRPPITVTADKSVFGGAFLHRLWDLKGPTVADFKEYAERFVAEVKRNRARPVLFMAWAYPRLGWISMAEIAQAHRDVAKSLQVDVAPVGLAWQQAAKERSGMDFYAPDREHPNILGTYLATCVIFTTIYDRDPSGLAYTPSGVTTDVAAFLQRVAWQTVRDYRAGRL